MEKEYTKYELFVDRQLVDHITLERTFGTDAARSC